MRYHGSLNKGLWGGGGQSSECVWFNVCRRYTNCASNVFQQLNCVAGRMGRAKPSKRWVMVVVVVVLVVVVVVVLLIMLIITITAITNNVTAVHVGTYSVVISSRLSSPQLSQQIPTDGGLASNKTADRRTAAA